MLFEKVNLCYFNSLATSRSELVKKHHFKGVKKKKWISEEPRNLSNTVTGKGIFRKWLFFSFLFTKLLDDLIVPSSVPSVRYGQFVFWLDFFKELLVFQVPVFSNMSNFE